MPQVALKRHKVWFVGNDLVSIYHKSKAAGIITLYNWTQDRLITMTNKDFAKYRRKAYTLKETAALLNRNYLYFCRIAHDGTLPPPMGRGLNGAHEPKKPAYYTEEQIYKMRDLFAQTHIGAKRKDGLVTNNKTPTEDELRGKINGQFFVYVKDNDGNFVPMWKTEP